MSWYGRTAENKYSCQKFCSVIHGKDGNINWQQSVESFQNNLYLSVLISAAIVNTMQTWQVWPRASQMLGPKQLVKDWSNPWGLPRNSWEASRKKNNNKKNTKNPNFIFLQFPASSGGRKKPTYLKMTSALSRTVGVLFPLLFIYIQ